LKAIVRSPAFSNVIDFNTGARPHNSLIRVTRSAVFLIRYCFKIFYKLNNNLYIKTFFPGKIAGAGPATHTRERR
jgi:hypothetical protein